MSIRQYWFVLWELTKRELKRKYARSFLGILWSCVYPLMRMALVVVLFSTIFNKGIDKYPAYYFVGFLMFEFFATATQTSLTTLKDNRNLLIKSKLPRELFVLSRVLTAFVNFLLGCIPFAAVVAKLNVSLCERAEPLIVLPGSYKEASKFLDGPGNKVLMKSASEIARVRDELKERGLIKNAAMVERCGLPGEKVYRDLNEIDPNSSYFSVILVKEKEFDK